MAAKKRELTEEEIDAMLAELRAQIKSVQSELDLLQKKHRRLTGRIYNV